MTAALILERLETLGARVTARPGGLLHLALVNALDPSFLECVRARKQDILAILSERAARRDPVDVARAIVALAALQVTR